MAAQTQPRTLSRRQRVLIENLTAYAFIIPAGLLILIFGIFPVIFAFFVSAHRWRRFPDEYIGLGNYARALGDFAYVLFFWVALAALLLGMWQLGRMLRVTLLKPGERPFSLYALPGLVNALALYWLGHWFFLLLPQVLNIPRRIRGQERVQGLFVNELVASFQVPEIASAGNLALLVTLLAIGFSLLLMRLLKGDGTRLIWQATSAFSLIALGGLTLNLTLGAVNAAVEAARVEGTELAIGAQIILISAGASLLYGAYRLWQRAVRLDNDRRFLLLGLAAITLMLGAYLLIAELPRALGSSDDEMLNSFSVTIMYALCAVPLQLAIGLGLAYLLFQKLKGKTLFRMIFFMPYIMPFLATALVFALIFSHREDSIINHIVGWFGIPPQKWLLEPLGIGRLIVGADVPAFLSGPSLALIVVIIYTIWTYAGYATVVFLAGLGNISGELYEAARIDGASGWAIFRHITLPLLSPTTFFLSLVAVIGTFQAFTQLWLMKTPAARNTLDTTSIYIFQTVTDQNPNYGYGAALAFVLFGVILLLTLVQNKFAERRVFYG